MESWPWQGHPPSIMIPNWRAGKSHPSATSSIIIQSRRIAFKQPLIIRPERFFRDRRRAPKHARLGRDVAARSRQEVDMMILGFHMPMRAAMFSFARDAARVACPRHGDLGLVAGLIVRDEPDAPARGAGRATGLRDDRDGAQNLDPK